MSAVAHASIGIGLEDVDQWAVAGIEPRSLWAIQGSFSADSIDESLAACSECPAADTSDRADWRIYSWGDDFENLRGQENQPPLFDQLGRGGRLAVRGSLAARALWTEGIRSMTGAYEDGHSLADDEDFRLAADAMFDLGALVCLISDQTPGPEHAQKMQSNPPGGNPQTVAAWTIESGDTVLRPYSVVAYGPGWDEEGAYTAIVLVHEDASSASENAERLRDRLDSARLAFPQIDAENWGQLFSAEDVTADGRVLTAKLRGLAFSVGPLSVQIHALLLEPILLHE